MRFRLSVEYVQPNDSGAPVRYFGRGRWKAASASGDTDIDGALANRRTRVLQVWKGPPPLGTRWQVIVQDVTYNIDDVFELENALGVMELKLSTTEDTGEYADG